MTAFRDVGAVVGDAVVTALGWLLVTSVAYQHFVWRKELASGIGFGVVSAAYVAWRRFRARKEPPPVRWGPALRRGRLPDDERGCAALARHVDKELRGAHPLWLTVLVIGGVAAAVIVWATLAGGTHRLVGATVFTALTCLVLAREYVWLRQLARMKRLLETLRPNREGASW